MNFSVKAFWLTTQNLTSYDTLGSSLTQAGTGFSSLVSGDDTCQVALRAHTLSWWSSSRTRCQHPPSRWVFSSWCHFLQPLVPCVLLLPSASPPVLLSQSAQLTHQWQEQLVPTLGWKPQTFLGEDWETTLNNQCPDHSTGSCDENVCGGWRTSWWLSVCTLRTHRNISLISKHILPPGTK